MKSKLMGQSFIDSFTDYDPAQLTPELLEVALDHVFDNDIVKDIPILKTIAGIYKASASIRDRALAKKIINFLTSLKSVSEETRLQFKAKMNVDEDFRRKVGEQLLLIIDRLDDMGKPALIASAFKAYMEEAIDFTMFQRLACSIDKSLYQDLMALKSSRAPNRLSPQAKLELSNSCIIELQSTPSINLSSKNNQYQITELGRVLLKYVLQC